MVNDKPGSVGAYPYAPTGTVILSPNSYYFIVLTSGSAVANGAYEWGEGASPANVSGGWLEVAGVARSATGTSGWLGVSPAGFAQLAIYATAIPESGVLSLFILGGWLLRRHGQEPARE